jgi:hypothetical protein
VDMVLHWLLCAAEIYGDTIPYAMVQPCMLNRKENKVVVLNGKASHRAETRIKTGIQYCKRPYTEIFAFAEKVVKDMAAADSCFQSEGMVRVDIFQTTIDGGAGRFVVNELESLEANWNIIVIVFFFSVKIFTSFQ